MVARDNLFCCCFHMITNRIAVFPGTSEALSLVRCRTLVWISLCARFPYKYHVIMLLLCCYCAQKYPIVLTDQKMLNLTFYGLSAWLFKSLPSGI